MFKIFLLFPLSIVYKSFLLEWQRASFSNATWTSFCRPFKWIWVVYLSGYNFIHCFLPLSHQTFFLYIFILVWCSWSKSCYVFCHLFSPFLNCVRSLRLTRTTLSSIAGCSSNEMIAAVSEVQINVENTVENDQVLFFFFCFFKLLFDSYFRFDFTFCCCCKMLIQGNSKKSYLCIQFLH